MTYVKQSIGRPTGNQGRSLMVHDEVCIVDVDDIKTMPSPDEGGVTITDDVAMNIGCYGVRIYLTPGTAEVTEPSEGDPDQEGFKPQVKFNHPGNTKALREFKHHWINRKVIVFIAYCDGTVDMIGTPCNPCRLQTSYTGNKDGNTNEITFAQSMKGDGIYVYEGALPPEHLIIVNKLDDQSLGFQGRGYYSLPAAANVTNISQGKDGDLLTITGSSDSSKATVLTSQTSSNSGNILLKTATATLPAGAQLTLRAVETANGLIWIEQSRTTV